MWAGWDEDQNKASPGIPGGPAAEGAWRAASSLWGAWEQGGVQPWGWKHPSPLQQEEAHGHCGPSCRPEGKSPGKAAGPSFVSRVDTARPGTPEPGCGPRNAKPCSTWKTNRTICPHGRKSNNKTHDSEQEPRRNPRKLGFSPQQKRSRVRNHRCPSYSERAVPESKHLPCTCRLCS